MQERDKITLLTETCFLKSGPPSTPVRRPRALYRPRPPATRRRRSREIGIAGHFNSESPVTIERRTQKLTTAAIGGAIKLFKASAGTLAVTEGIETALAVRCAVSDRPVWACYSASVSTKFKPPGGVDRVIVWGDLDEGGAGQLAAAKLVLRLRKQGLQATLLLPGRGTVYLRADTKSGWYSSDATREEIVKLLEGERYRVSNDAEPSTDWLDNLKVSRVMVESAFRNLRLQGW